MHSTTQKKAWKDGDTLYHHARAVIILNDKGEVREVKHKITGALVNVLAIIGPITLNGKYIRRAVRAEIGFGRTAPYKLAEARIRGERVRTFPRKVYQPLTTEEELYLLPFITKVVQQVVDKEVMHWKRLTFTKSMHSDSEVYTRGKFITVPPNMPVLSFLCLAQDMKTRTNGHLSAFASCTRLRLNKVRYATYSPKELKRIKAVQHTAYNLGEAKYGEHILGILRKKIGRVGSKARSLFEQILEVYKIQPHNKRNDSLYLGYKRIFTHLDERDLLANFALDVVTHEKRIARREQKKLPTYRHACGCLRVEIRPSAEAVNNHLSNPTT